METKHDPRHVPVLLNETLEALALQPGENVIDCTLGMGGHASAMLDATTPTGKLLGFDADEAALDAARSNLGRFGSRAMLVHESYRNVGKVLHTSGFGPVHAALLDAGFSSFVIDDPARGFSFRADGPLDMRFDARQETTAAGIVNEWPLDDLARILWGYGEERFARKIAEAIVEARRTTPITGTIQLTDIIAHAVPAWYRRHRTHFATKTFQALRIAVNDELTGLEETIPQLFEALEPGGRLAIISFHSLEDRIVKHAFRDLEQAGKAKLYTKRPIIAGDDEAGKNPRSRSAKLRVLKKT